MKIVDAHPALVAALARAGGEGSPEGVHVRQACGFAPSSPFVAEITKMSPVGPVIVRADGATREEAVDAAREKLVPTLLTMVPADSRERAARRNDPAERARERQEAREAGEQLLELLGLSDDKELLALLPGSEEE